MHPKINLAEYIHACRNYCCNSILVLISISFILKTFWRSYRAISARPPPLALNPPNSPSPDMIQTWFWPDVDTIGTWNLPFRVRTGSKSGQNRGSEPGLGVGVRSGPGQRGRSSWNGSVLLGEFPLCLLWVRYLVFEGTFSVFLRLILCTGEILEFAEWPSWVASFLEGLGTWRNQSYRQAGEHGNQCANWLALLFTHSFFAKHISSALRILNGCSWLDRFSLSYTVTLQDPPEYPWKQAYIGKEKH